jgi:hypothetical protein
VNGIPYKGITTKYGGVNHWGGYDERTKFINNIKRNKWVYSTEMVDEDWISRIHTVEEVLNLYPNYNMDGNWDGTFYSGVEKVNITITASVDWSENMKNIMQNLPYRNQDHRDTYITDEWGGAT